MIINTQGDIFQETDVDIIAHQANCFHTMGSGIAAQVAEQFPEALAADQATEYGDMSKLGTMSMADIEREGRKPFTIVNIYGQYMFGRSLRDTRYDALYDGLDMLKARLMQTVPPKGQERWRLAVPYKMGCHLGGASWTVVDAMLTDLFANCDKVDLVICEFTPPVEETKDKAQAATATA